MIEFGSKGKLTKTDALNAYIAFSAAYIAGFLNFVGIEDDVLNEKLECVAHSATLLLDDSKLVTEFEPDIFLVYLTAKGYEIQ